MEKDQKIDEVLDIVRTERDLNNSRFVQLSTGVHEISHKLDETNRRIDKVESNLKEQIDKVYTTLSDDIQAFGTDLEKVRRRVDKVERKIA